MQPGVYRSTANQWQFSLWAPFTERVQVVFADASLSFDLEKGQHGYWTKTLESLPPDAVYWYRLNGNLKRADPASAWQPEGIDGPSRVVDHHAFHWTDSDYQPVPLADYIIYEIHIGTFTPAGTFAAATERLQELKELGITAVEIMPISQFPGSRNWGYDGVYPYAVQNTYGGPDAFKLFIDTVHRLGLAVILDVVYNHVGPEGNYLRDFGPYFTNHYKTPWGEAINFDRAFSDAVRDYFIENALYWFRDYHMNALRLDALHSVFDMSAKHFLRELAERVGDLSQQHKRPYYLIGESDLNDVRLIEPMREGGYGLDAQWSDDFHHSLHTLLTGERFGYYQDFGTAADLAKALQEGFVYDGRYSSFRKRHHGSSSRARPAEQFVVCTQNHDQIGNRMKGDRLAQLVDFEGLKLAAGCLLLSPCIPLLFMGEESGEDHPFQYFVSMKDADLVEAIRRGRAEEFSGFQWQGECPDPQERQTFERSKLQWEKRGQDKHKVLLGFYQHLIQLRKAQAPFVSKKNLSVGTIESQGIVYWQRQWDTQQWLCLMNFSRQPQAFTCPVSIGACQKILDSSDRQWLGPGSSAPAEATGPPEIEMPSHSLYLYEAQTHAYSNSDISFTI